MSKNERKDIVKKLSAVLATAAMLVGVLAAPASAATQAVVPTSWGLDRIDQATSQLDNSFTTPLSGGAGVRVYVLDTGVEGDLMSFGGRVEKGFDATTGTGGRADDDCHGHGTHVAGTIASSQFGVAPKATIVPVRVATCRGGVSSTWLYRALEWVLANHPKGTPGVVNMSIAVQYNEPVNNLADKLYREGLVVVTASGNYQNRVDACKLSPSSTKSILTVGSVDSNGFMTRIGNYDNCVDIYAPGGSIVSEDPLISSRVRSGTSMASPHVAGAAALYLGIPGNQGAAMFNHLVVRHAAVGTIPNLPSGDNRVLDITFINQLAKGALPPASVPSAPVEETFEESAPEEVQTLATAPLNLVVMSGATRMVIVWNHPRNADRVTIDHYRIEYSYDRGGSWRMLTRAAAGATEAQTPKPPVGRLVSFRVLAVTAAGDGESSNVVTTRIAP
jgi:subtilisin family serine protease